jgi:pimeloyl-ACP methyl ester carboxylesterase
MERAFIYVAALKELRHRIMRDVERMRITADPAGIAQSIFQSHVRPIIEHYNPIVSPLASHYGDGFYRSRKCNGAVPVGGEDGNDPLQYDPSLDMYDPRNGPPYSQEFRKRYETAQEQRNRKITRWCKTKIAEMKRAANPLLKDIPFIVHRTDANLRYLDLAIDSSDRSGRTIWNEDPREANYTVGPLRGNSTRLRVLTLRSWLSQRGLDTFQLDIMQHLPFCHLPVLVICGTADAQGPQSSKDIFNAALDPQKKLVWIKGGTHFMVGQEDKQAEVADGILHWLRERNLG